MKDLIIANVRFGSEADVRRIQKRPAEAGHVLEGTDVKTG